MITLIIFLLMSFGLTGIMTQEYITRPIRKLIPYKPFTCCTCFSFWSGFMLSFLFPTLLLTILSPVLYGLISYAFQRILSTWLISKGEIHIDD